MSTVIDTTEAIIGEIDELRSDAFRAESFVEEGKFHEALEQLQNVLYRVSEAEHLIKREMQK
jgi:cob(I)alamin adenosyltransferase